MQLTDITVDQLHGWEIPTLEETTAYWAFRGNPGTLPVLSLPHHDVHGVLPQDGLKIYVDPGEGWLWAKVPTRHSRWLTFEQARTFPLPAEDEVIPAWVGAAARNYPSLLQGDDRDPQPPLLVRRRISGGEAEALLDEIMPRAAEYPLDEPLAAIVRLGGWAPEDFRLLWWTVTTRADAVALAAHLPYWWDVREWGRFFLAPDSPPPLPARILGDLAARGVRPDVADCCIWYGITDVDRIAALRPPTIPDDATRIAYPGMRSPVIDVDPVAAREDLERDPERWLRPIDVTTGVRPLHIETAPVHFGRHFAVWSDGQLTDGVVNPPGSLPDGETARDWRLRYRAFGATHHLLLSILSAQNRADLDSEVWMPWHGATRADTEVVATASTDRPIGTDRTARRLLTLSRHTIHHDDERRHHLWQLDETVTITTTPRNRPEHTTVHSAWHTLHTTAAAAEQAYTDADNGLPPLETVEEIAARANLTRDAVAQAISRGRKARLERTTGHPRSLDRTRPDPGPPEHETVGRANWYEPRAFLAWLASRPGHGPGRGHTTSGPTPATRHEGKMAE